MYKWITNLIPCEINICIMNVNVYDKQLRNNEILIVKVKWSHHLPKGIIWWVEELIKQKYIHT